MERTKLFENCAALSLITCTKFNSISNSSDRNQSLITISVSENPPWNFESPPGSGCFCGVSITLLAVIAEKLGFRYTLFPANTLMAKYTTSDGTKYEGAPADLLLGTASMSICPLAVTALRIRHFELVYGYWPRVYHIAVHSRWFATSDLLAGGILFGLFNSALTGTLHILSMAGLVVLCTLVFVRVRTQKPLVGTVSAKLRCVARMALQALYTMIASFFVDIDIPRSFFGVKLMVFQWLLSLYFVFCVMNAKASSSLAVGSSPIPPFQTAGDYVRSNFDPLFQMKSAPTEFMVRTNSAAFQPLVPRMRQYDAGGSLSMFLAYAASLSQTEKVAILSLDETPLFYKSGFKVAIPSQFYNHITIYQLERGSPMGSRMDHIVIQLAKTGILKRIIDLHLEILYAANNLPYLPRFKPSRQHTVSTGMEVLFSTYFAAFGLLAIATIVFASEICVNMCARWFRRSKVSPSVSL